MDLHFLHNPDLKVVPNFCVQIVGRPKLNYPNQFSGVISKVVCHIPHQEVLGTQPNKTNRAPGGPNIHQLRDLNMTSSHFSPKRTRIEKKADF